MGEIFNTGTVEFRAMEKGVLRGVALPDRRQTLDDAHRNLEAARRLIGGGRAPLLMDIRTTGTLTREAREFYAGEEGARTITALAFLGGSAFTRVVGNIFIRLAKSRFPVRLFLREEEAMQWLEKIKP